MTHYNSKNMLMITPITPDDINDLIKYLRRHKASILVNMSKCPIGEESMIAIIDCIIMSAGARMEVTIKRVFPKVFVCCSKRKVFSNKQQ